MHISFQRDILCELLGELFIRNSIYSKIRPYQYVQHDLTIVQTEWDLWETYDFLLDMGTKCVQSEYTNYD